MSLKVNPIVATIAFVLIGVLLVATIRGCKNNQQAEALVVDYSNRINDLVKDSIGKEKKLIEYNKANEMLDGQLSLSNNKLLSLNGDLDKANDRISILLSKHVPIKASLDTTVTLAPNSFIDDCADCFKELRNGQQLVKQYKYEKENQYNLLSGKLNLKDNRIKELEASNMRITSNYRSLLDSASRLQYKNKPHGRLYLSWGVLWSPWPIAAGAGLMYQNKRNLIWGLKCYYGQKGTIFETNINFPLSLRFK
jgi:hypothetical protein